MNDTQNNYRNPPVKDFLASGLVVLLHWYQAVADEQQIYSGLRHFATMQHNVNYNKVSTRDSA